MTDITNITCGIPAVPLRDCSWHYIAGLMLPSGSSLVRAGERVRNDMTSVSGWLFLTQLKTIR